MYLRTRCELLMWKGSWLNVRAGESNDRSVTQFPVPIEARSVAQL